MHLVGEVSLPSSKWTMPWVGERAWCGRTSPQRFLCENQLAIQLEIPERLRSGAWREEGFVPIDEQEEASVELGGYMHSLSAPPRPESIDWLRFAGHLNGRVRKERALLQEWGRGRGAPRFWREGRPKLPGLCATLPLEESPVTGLPASSTASPPLPSSLRGASSQLPTN